MTLVLGSLAFLLLGAMTSLTMDVSHVAALRTRAQIAADAAALAAAAESAPVGRNLQTQQARRFAELNGAELVRCVCDPGASAVQVEVEIDGVSALARAVIDPAALIPMTSAAGFHPVMEAAINRLLSEAAGRVSLVSGFRSSERQAELWNQALARYGSPEQADDWVAPPGHSMHERGLAADLGGDLSLAVRLVSRLGLPLYRPLDNEPWHFELIGSRG